MKKQKTISRRTVLRGMGTVVSLPFLEAMMPNGFAHATDLEKPMRMMFFMVPNGAHMPAWTPAKEGKE